MAGLQLPEGPASRKACREASLSESRWWSAPAVRAGNPRVITQRFRAGPAGKGSLAGAAEDGGAVSAAGPAPAAASGAPAAAADGPSGALRDWAGGPAGRGGGASSGRGPGTLRHAGGRAGTGLRPGAALPPPPAAAEGEPAESDEGGCSELSPEHQHRQRAENQ